MFKFIIVILILIHISLFSQNWDIKMLEHINLERNKHFDNSLIFISNSRSIVSISTFACFVTYGYLKKDSTIKQKALSIGIGLAAASFLTQSLKYSFNRKRPYVTHPEIQKLSSGGSPSFPSGHTSEAFSAATAFSLEYKRWYISVPAFIWASSVAYSRMHLGVHYPSDVLAGAIIGIGSAYFSHWLTQKICHKKTNYVVAANH
ncbi:MAG: phosphatase PAP2 family protein [Bacteroidales bacterium]|nr:phosphatase PAP2 family protein [Bacteroidales bacterium]